MKKIIFLFVLSLTFASITFAQSKAKMPPAADQPKLPAAKKVFKTYVKNIGGRKTLEKIKNRQLIGTVELPAMGLKGTFEITSKSPSKSIAVINLNGFGEIIEAFDGSEAWAKNPLQGLRVKTGKELGETAKSSGFYAYDLDLEKNYPQAVVSGIEQIGGADAYAVKADDDTTFYFDMKTGLLVQLKRNITSPQGRISSTTEFADYREVDGYKTPYKITQSALGADFVFNVSEVRQNIEIGDEKFSRPK